MYEGGRTRTPAPVHPHIEPRTTLARRTLLCPLLPSSSSVPVSGRTRGAGALVTGLTCITRRALAGLALVTAAPLASAQTAPAIVTASSGSALDLLPGTAGVPVSSFTQAALRLSRTGRWYALTVNATSQPSPSDTYVLIGTTQGIVESIVETAALPGLGFGFSARPDARIGVNDLGDIAFSGTTTNPSVNANDVVVRYDRSAGVWVNVAVENTPIPGVAGENFSPLMDSVTLLDDGRVAFVDSATSGALPSSQDELLFLATPGAPAYSVLAQAGVLVPANQAGGTTAFLSDIFEATVSADGLSYILEGGLIGVPSTQFRVAVVDGVVVHQQGDAIPGLTGVATSNFSDVEMFPGGDWAILSGTTNNESYLLVNGAVRLKEGDPVPGGLPGETVDTLRHVDINRHGDLAVHTETSARSVVLFLPANPAQSGRVQFATATTAGVTTGTRLDLDGDCDLDDAYLVFLNDDATGIDDDGRVYGIGRFANSFSTTVGDALFSSRRIGAIGADCDGNGLADDCEIGKDPLLDQDLNGVLDVCQSFSLTVDTLIVSRSEGGVQTFALAAGPAFASQFYILLGSASGTAPGVPLGSVTLPLNPDAYTNLVLAGGGSFSGFLGFLDGNGSATAALIVPAGTLSPSLVGLSLRHAALVFDGVGFTFASNPVAFELGA